MHRHRPLHCSDLGPPFLHRPQPSPVAPPSALPCCCTRSEGRRPELCPLCLKVTKMNESSGRTIVILFFWRCLVLLPPLLCFDSCELSCTEVDSYRYQYICQYIHAWKCQDDHRTIRMTRGATNRPGRRLIVTNRLVDLLEQPDDWTTRNLCRWFIANYLHSLFSTLSLNSC
jgi:hypothetical protein